MTEREICISYREARNPIEQLRILADLNCMDKVEIVRILIRNGEKLTKPTIDLIYKWLDQLDRRLVKKERKYLEITKNKHCKKPERLEREIAEVEYEYHEIVEILNMVKA